MLGLNSTESRSTLPPSRCPLLTCVCQMVHDCTQDITSPFPTGLALKAVGERERDASLLRTEQLLGEDTRIEHVGKGLRLPLVPNM